MINKNCETVAVTRKVYLHQKLGFGRAEQNCTLCLQSQLFLLHFTVYTCPAVPGTSLATVEDGWMAQNYVWNRLCLLKRILEGKVLLTQFIYKETLFF